MGRDAERKNLLDEDFKAINLSPSAVFIAFVLAPIIFIVTLLSAQMYIAWRVGRSFVLVGAMGSWYAVWLPATVLVISVVALIIGVLLSYRKSPSEMTISAQSLLLIGVGWLISLFTAGIGSAVLANGNHDPTVTTGFWGGVLRAIIPYTIIIALGVVGLLFKYKKETTIKPKDLKQSLIMAGLIIKRALQQIIDPGIFPATKQTTAKQGEDDVLPKKRIKSRESR